MALEVVPISIDPDPLAPYAISPGWKVGDLIFLSGQAALSPQGEIVGENDFDAQIGQIMANIKTVLKAAGSDLDKIVKVTIYLTDMKYFPKIIEARKSYFKSPYPADTIVEVSSLALPQLLVEIDVIAVSA